MPEPVLRRADGRNKLPSGGPIQPALTALASATTDRKVVAALNSLAHKDADYWEFKQQSERLGVHGLMQYPAMMVPKMQGVLLDTLLAASPQIRHVCDPFVGAGTTLVESLVRGLNFSGFDINPLAILLCSAKSQCFSSAAFEAKAAQVAARCASDRGRTIDVAFPGRDKWFSKTAAIELSRIRRSVLAEPERWARLLMWAALAETIRKTSNARTSTYKLHIRPQEQIGTLPSPQAVFAVELAHVVQRLAFHARMLAARNLLASDGKYAGSINLHCQDVRAEVGDDMEYDLVITSPPYGDNRSTVAYGQFSYLALNWIPAADLSGDNGLYASAYATDTRSLGGSWARSDRKTAVLLAMSPAFAGYQHELKKQGRKELEAKVASFAYDFFDALTAITRRARNGAYVVWTLGDRTVGGIPVPFTQICREMQESLGLRHVTTVNRQIPSKRTPSRNAVGDTMGAERLLIMRK